MYIMPVDTPNPITLIATIGSSPAVLTEAVYALHKYGEWPVEEIKIITTAHGAERIKECLFGENKVWIRLCEELGIDPYSIKIPFRSEIKGVRDDNGKELKDIQHSGDDRIMASHIQQLVKQEADKSDRRLFGLLSGGRKTMSSHLMAAFQLFARRSDRLFHILVSEPYENIPDFYFPTSQSVMLPLYDHNGAKIDECNAQDARVNLIDIPYLRLRPFLETEIDYGLSFDELLAMADEKLYSYGEYPVYDFHVHLDGSNSGIYINGKENKCELEPRQISIIALFIWMNIQQGEPFDIRWKDVTKDQDLRQALHTFYRTAKEGNFTGIDEKTRQINIAEITDDWLDYEYWYNKKDQPLKRAFSKNKSILFKKMTRFLQKSFSGDVKREHIIRETGENKKLVEKIFRVPIPVSKCRITGLHPKDAEGLALD